MKAHQGNSGVTLVELLIALVVTVMIGLGTITALRNAAIYKHDVDQNIDFNSLTTTLELTLENLNLCAATFQNVTLNANNNSAQSIGIPLMANAHPINLVAGVTYGDLVINSLTLSPTGAISGSANSYTANLQITASKGAGKMGGSQLTRTLPMQFQINPASNSIISCMASSNPAAFAQTLCTNSLVGATWDATNSMCSVSPGTCGNNQVIAVNPTTGVLYCRTIDCSSYGGNNYVVKSINFNSGPTTICEVVKPQCVSTTCSAPVQCGVTSYGVDNCGAPCSNVGAACPVCSLQWVGSWNYTCGGCNSNAYCCYCNNSLFCTSQDPQQCGWQNVIYPGGCGSWVNVCQ